MGAWSRTSDLRQDRTASRWDNASGAVWALLIVALLVAAVSPDVYAKTPGGTHCYKKICHRVKTLSETSWWIGKTIRLTATHYDDPSVDHYNTGKYTSSGEIFDADDPTRTSSSNFPDGTELLVWNPQNGRALHVRVNDFGPFHTDRTLDLTRAAAERLGMAKQGVARLEVIVVAAPPVYEPVYKRGRRYAPTLGYIGVLGKRQVDALAQRLVESRRQGRLATIDIQRFLWTTPVGDLNNDAFQLPLPRMARRVSRAGILAAFQESDYAAPPPPRYPRPQLETIASPDRPGPLRFASLADARPLREHRRQIAPLLITAGRFALPLGRAERAGWRSPPRLMPQRTAARLSPRPPLRLAALRTAPRLPPATRFVEVAATGIESIRWSIPGLDTFMRAMTPIWGPKVTPFTALQAALAMIFVLVMSLMAMTYTWITGRTPVLVGRGRRRMFDPDNGPDFAVLVRQEPPQSRRSSAAWHPRLIIGGAAPDSDGLAAQAVDEFADGTQELLAPATGSENTPPALALVEAEPISLRAYPAGASILGPHLAVEGRVASTGTIVVQGSVIGEICCDCLIVEEGGSVDGSIRAMHVKIAGTVSGAVKTARFEVCATGDYEGEVHHSSLAVAHGAGFEATLVRLPEAAE